MKKRRALPIFFLVLALLLCACGSKQEAAKAEPEKAAEAAEEVKEEAAEEVKEEAKEAEAAAGEAGEEAAEKAEEKVEEKPAAETAEEKKAVEEKEEPAAEPEDLSYDGEYTFLCALFSAEYLDSILEYGMEVQDIDDQYVKYPQMEGNTVTLKEDGTGELYWGENNNGPIDWWKMDGDKLQLKAGVSEMEGTIRKGIMTLVMEEGNAICFAAPGAKTNEISPITLDEFFEKAYGVDISAPAEGTYTLFAIGREGYIVDSREADMTAVVELNKGGTGIFTMDDDEMAIASWKTQRGRISITMEDESSAMGKIHDGIIELDIMGDGTYMMYLAADGADTSSYSPMTMEEYREAYNNRKPDSRLEAFLDELDVTKGIHLNYELIAEAKDSVQYYDVHAKGTTYYSDRRTVVSGKENEIVTFIGDGGGYNLDPKKKTGTYVTSATATSLAKNVIMMDGLYSDIWTRAGEADFTVETREEGGVSYTAEVYPADAYRPEAEFWFDDDGMLVKYIKGVPVVEVLKDLGETVYVIHAVDDKVDEKLFDISEYKIAE